MTSDLYPTDRLARAQKATAAAGLDALLITPGPDLTYLTGYHALPLERLTCLVLPANGDPSIVVPTLERPAAEASSLTGLGLEILDWNETEDPYRLVADRLVAAGATDRVGLDNHMWAEKVLALRAALPDTAQSLAGDVLRELRMRKSAGELAALRRAGAAIDSVHREIGQWLRAGRTEREIGRDIADAIIAAGHTRVDFVIVGSGPNGASPHHELSDRTVQAGEPVVIDIGGMMPDGFRSDCTRNYCVGQPPADYTEYFQVLRAAQAAQCEQLCPGVTAERLDAIGREVITEAGYGEYFVHRTGHGIGLETHEEPYIISGNTLPLEAGMTFSIEPGIYLPGRHGARIEDIVAVTETGCERFNQTTRDLVVLD